MELPRRRTGSYEARPALGNVLAPVHSGQQGFGRKRFLVNAMYATALVGGDSSCIEGCLNFDISLQPDLMIFATCS